MTLLFAKIDGAEFAFVAELEGETGPAIGPAGMGGVAVVGETQTGKTENSSLPDRTTTSVVNTLCSVESEIFQINQSTCHEEVVGSVDQTSLTGENDVESWREGRAEIVVGDGIVVISIGFLRLIVKVLVEDDE